LSETGSQFFIEDKNGSRSRFLKGFHMIRGITHHKQITDVAQTG